MIDNGTIFFVTLWYQVLWQFWDCGWMWRSFSPFLKLLLPSRGGPESIQTGLSLWSCFSAHNALLSTEWGPAGLCSSWLPHVALSLFWGEGDICGAFWGCDPSSFPLSQLEPGADTGTDWSGGERRKRWRQRDRRTKCHDAGLGKATEGNTGLFLASIRPVLLFRIVWSVRT